VPLGLKVKRAQRVFALARAATLRPLLESDVLNNGRGDEALRQLARYKPIELGVRKERFPSVGWNDLFGAKEPDPGRYLVEDLVAEVQPCVVAGLEKTLKTSFTLDLAVSLATGYPFLGWGVNGYPLFPVGRPRNVLIMSAESGRPTLERNLRTVMRG